MKFIDLIRNAFIDDDTKPTKRHGPEQTLEKSHQPIKRKELNLYQNFQQISDFSNVYQEPPKNLLDVFLWPPNAFVVCAKFLDVTGVYKRIVASQKDSPWTGRNREQVLALGQCWSDFCLSDTVDNPTLPHHNLLELIYSIFKAAKTRQNLKELMDDTKYLQRRATPDSRETLNLMIFPWPKIVEDEYFNPVEDQGALKMDEEFGFFEYSHQEPFDFDTVVATIDKARAQNDTEIDLVVFPECAMSAQNANLLASTLYEHYRKTGNLDNCPTLVTGIFKEGGKSR